MSVRKKKALASELIDDLLDEDSSSSKSSSKAKTLKNRKKKKHEKSSGRGSSKPHATSTSESKPQHEKQKPNPPEQPESDPKPENDRTVALSESQILSEPISKSGAGTLTPSRTSYVSSASVGSPLSQEQALQEANNLRIAQQRILDLEHEIERLRTENEQLAAAGEAFRRRVDGLTAKSENAERKLEEAKDVFSQEKDILTESIETRDRELGELKMTNEQLEARLSSSIKKIRVRERELENRLELLKIENTALARSKDQTLLDLKRQIDQLNAELDNYRDKGVELSKRLTGKQDVLRRTVKALRLALSMLEQDQDRDNPAKLKKVD